MDVGRSGTELLEAMALMGLGIRCNLDLRRGSRGLRCRNVWHEASERVKKFSDLFS